MKQREKRNIVIGLLCVMVVFMSVGYAVLSQNLRINGTANITGSWKIEITSITPENINEGTSVSTSIADSKTEGTFVANLKKPTDAVIYTVTVENKGTIDAVLESITPEDYTSGDIKYTTTGKEDCKNLDAGATCDFTIKVEYLDTGAGQQPTPNGTKVEQKFEIKYVQEGSNVNTPGGGTDGDDTNTPAITVDSNGLVTGFNKEKLTNDEGYVVVPATTEEGEEIVSIDKNSFAEYNFASAYIYNPTTDEEIETLVIYDEENYDIIEEALASEYGGRVEATGTSTTFDHNVNPSGLSNKENQNCSLQKLATTTSDGYIIYSKTEFESLLNQIENAEVEYDYGYVNVETSEFENPTRIEKLDLTQATNLKTIEEYTFKESPLKEIKFSDSIEEIASSAFESSELTSVVLPKSLKTIGSYALAELDLSKLVISSDFNLDKNQYAFNNTTIQSVIIEEGVTNIPEYLFYWGNGKIYNLTLPSTLKTIGKYAFAENALSSVVIPAGVETIGEHAFARNPLTSLTIAENSKLKSIGTFAFAQSSTTSTYGITGNVTIPASVTNIDAAAFYGNKINSLTFEDSQTNPSQLTTIGDSTFAYNALNQTVVIPASVTTIGNLGLARNADLETIIIKRESNEGMSLGNLWNERKITGMGAANTTLYQVIYDPDYAG